MLTLPNSFLPFEKFESLGNDFVVIEEAALHSYEGDLPSLFKKLAHRRFGVGCDQIILLSPSFPNLSQEGEGGKGENISAFLRFFNADGSESGACGNGTRCVASFLMKKQGVSSLVLQTKTTTHMCQRTPDGGVQVDMGEARFSWRDIPLTTESQWEAFPTLLEGLSPSTLLLGEGYGVNVGNPHLVFLVPNSHGVDLETVGRYFENHPLFPERTNVGFADIVSPHQIRLRVWERGSGATLACGTGACAAMAVLHRLGKVADRLIVEQLGGTSVVQVREGRLWLEGPAHHPFSGGYEGIEPCGWAPTHLSKIKP